MRFTHKRRIGLRDDLVAKCHDLVAPCTSHRCLTAGLAHREVERCPVTARDLLIAKAHHPVMCATHDLVDTCRVWFVDTQWLLTVLVVRAVELGLLWDNLKRDSQLNQEALPGWMNHCIMVVKIIVTIAMLVKDICATWSFSRSAR